MLNKEKIDNYIFDLYGTLLDVKTDEQAAGTWKRWLKKVDERGLAHPPYYRFRSDFFKRDKSLRQEVKASTGCQVPEIDIIDVYRELFERYGNGILDDDTLAEIAYEFRKASREHIRLYPGVIEYLKKIEENGKRAFILSNAQRSYTWPEIMEFGLDKITVDQLISSDYKCMKPDVRFFDAIISKYNMDKEATLMHGDSRESDIEGAINAGILYVHLVGNNRPEKYYSNEIS